MKALQSMSIAAEKRDFSNSEKRETGGACPARRVAALLSECDLVPRMPGRILDAHSFRRPAG
jgi:hypothetical protein